jgi:signal transduction histidine kinase
MMRSLRKRLIWILLGLTLFAWITSASLTGVYAARLVIDQVDRQLEQYADLLNYITQVFSRQADEGLQLTQQWFGHDGTETHDLPMIIEGPLSENLSPALNIWHHDTLIAVLATSPRFDKPLQEGFSYRHVESDGRHWRILSRYEKRTGLWILVGIELDAARWALLGIFGRTLFPLLIILPLTIGLVYFGVSRGLLPLKALAGQISRRSPKLLDPVDARDVPAELQPVVSALNSLLQRLALALEGEQRFTANAAHELQTPLAAIKTEVQVCQRLLQDEEGKAGLERIALRVDRASHTVSQLLTLARVDPESSPPDTAIALRALMVEVVAETAHLAAERGLDVNFKAGNEMMIVGSEEALAILLRNLLINAFRYASVDSEVRIGLEPSGGGALLEISNDCNALEAAEFGRLTERFYRVPGSAGLGAGLGLSIVKRIADSHGASFTVRPESGGVGFCAQVAFPEIKAVREQRPVGPDALD